MTVPYFLDTNILIYAALPKNGGEAKRKKAADLIGGDEFGVSAQVLQEFYWTATRKGAPPLSPAEAIEWIEMLEQQPCIAIDANLVKVGIEYSERYQISYWDGAIVAAAEALGAPLLYSEDLNDGQTYGEVRVVNPFKSNNPAYGFDEDPAETRMKRR